MLCRTRQPKTREDENMRKTRTKSKRVASRKRVPIAKKRYVISSKTSYYGIG